MRIPKILTNVNSRGFRSFLEKLSVSPSVPDRADHKELKSDESNSLLSCQINYRRLCIGTLKLAFIEEHGAATVGVMNFGVYSRIQFQVSARTPDNCKARSSTVKCSSAPSTRRLSTSENCIAILFFCLLLSASS